MSKLAFLAFSALIVIAEAKAAVVPAEIYRHPQQMVSLGKRSLNFYCVGNGKPTVLLDSGSGDTMLPWHFVQLPIARFTKVCAYDRAGYGFSDPSPQPSDANAVAADIHQLIRYAHMGSPLVYVGHSIAGLYGVLLEAKHPDDVAGEVLVDPSFVGQFPPKGIGNAARAIAAMRACLVLAEKDALVHPETKAAQLCVAVDGVPDPALRRILAILAADPKNIRTSISEFENFAPPRVGQPSTDERELGQVKVDFGNKPLTVLTRTNFDDPGATSQEIATRKQAWIAGHDKIAALSTRGKSVMVPHSNHHIQIIQPDAVVSAVRDVVIMVRQRK